MAVFLVIDNMEVDNAEAGAYTVYEEELGVSERMADGTLVEEVRGHVWVVEVDLGAMEQAKLQAIQNALRSRRVHQLFFLPPTGQNNLSTGLFRLTELPKPSLESFLDDDDDEPDVQIWNSFALKFEEIRPHD